MHERWSIKNKGGDADYSVHTVVKSTQRSKNKKKEVEGCCKQDKRYALPLKKPRTFSMP